MMGNHVKKRLWMGIPSKTPLSFMPVSYTSKCYLSTPILNFNFKNLQNKVKFMKICLFYLDKMNCIYYNTCK